MANDEAEEREFALQNSVVLREIFQSLSTKDLLELSCVNRVWNQECRSVLRDMKKCVAVFKGDDPCLKAKEFNDMMEKSAASPFNGLSITIEETHECNAEDVCGNLLDMPVKYLDFSWQKRPGSKICALGSFILRLLATSQSLESLNIMRAPTEVIFEQVDWPKPQAQLPKLRTLNFENQKSMGREKFEGYDRANFLQLLARAPNLEEVQSRCPLDWLQPIPLEKMHIIRNVVLFEMNGEDIAKIGPLWQKFLQSEPKLHSLSIRGRCIHNSVTKEEFRHGLVSVLHSSCDSLRRLKLDCDCMWDVRIIAEKLPVLRNVTELIFSATYFDPVTSLQFRRWPLARVLPSVIAVSFWSVAFFSVWSFEAENHEVYPWETVTQVKLQCWNLCAAHVADLGVMFPNTRIFEAELRDRYDDYYGFPFEQVWSSLSSLERLKVKMAISSRENFDAQFCGIYPEEAKLLQGKDQDYLRAVNIVPPFPAINHLKGLKSLEIELQTEFAFVPEELKSPCRTFFLSRVTALVALNVACLNLNFKLEFFRKMPDTWSICSHLSPWSLRKSIGAIQL